MCCEQFPQNVFFIRPKGGGARPHPCHVAWPIAARRVGTHDFTDQHKELNMLEPCACERTHVCHHRCTCTVDCIRSHDHGARPHMTVGCPFLLIGAQGKRPGALFFRYQNLYTSAIPDDTSSKTLPETFHGGDVFFRHRGPGLTSANTFGESLRRKARQTIR